MNTRLRSVLILDISGRPGTLVLVLFLKESFESDVTCIKYKIFTKSKEERANDMLHMIDKLQLKEVAMLRGSYI